MGCLQSSPASSTSSTSLSELKSRSLPSEVLSSYQSIESSCVKATFKTFITPPSPTCFSLLAASQHFKAIIDYHQQHDGSPPDFSAFPPNSKDLKKSNYVNSLYYIYKGFTLFYEQYRVGAHSAELPSSPSVEKNEKEMWDVFQTFIGSVFPSIVSNEANLSFLITIHSTWQDRALTPFLDFLARLLKDLPYASSSSFKLISTVLVQPTFSLFHLYSSPNISCNFKQIYIDRLRKSSKFLSAKTNANANANDGDSNKKVIPQVDYERNMKILNEATRMLPLLIGRDYSNQMEFAQIGMCDLLMQLLGGVKIPYNYSEGDQKDESNKLPTSSSNSSSMQMTPPFYTDTESIFILSLLQSVDSLMSPLDTSAQAKAMSNQNGQKFLLLGLLLYLLDFENPNSNHRLFDAERVKSSQLTNKLLEDFKSLRMHETLREMLKLPARDAIPKGQNGVGENTIGSYIPRENPFSLDPVALMAAAAANPSFMSPPTLQTAAQQDFASPTEQKS